MHRDPNMLTTSTNRNLFQPTKDRKARRRSEIRQSINKGKNRSGSSSQGSSDDPATRGAIESKLKRDRSQSASGQSDRSQLVDLIVEDTEAEEAERVRARKEGGDAWNRSQAKHFVRTYSIDEEAREGQEIREGFDPSLVPAKHPPPEHAVEEEEEEEEEEARDGDGDDDHEGPESSQAGRYGSLIQDDNVWSRT